MTDIPDILNIFSGLTDRQLRRGPGSSPTGGLFIAESPNVIRRALDAGLEPVAFLCEASFPVADFLGDAWRDVPVHAASPEEMVTITGFRLTRGLMAAFRRPAPLSPADVCGSARRIAVLQGIVDAANVGAIFRSAAALGIGAVLLTPDSCDPLNRRSVRSSMGAVFQVPWATVGPAPGAATGAVSPAPRATLEVGCAIVSTLHQLGYKTVAMALTDRSIHLDSSVLTAEPRLAIILGNEGDGLPASTISASDWTVRIPMSAGVDSLNVAAAAAIAFWQLR